MTRFRLRILALVLLLAMMFGQLVWFGAHPPVRSEPSTSTIYANYGAYVGQRVVVSGAVVRTDPVVIALEGVPDARLTVRGLHEQVRVGDRLQIYGVLRPDNEVDAIDAIVVPRWGLWYTYTVSFLAGVWVLLRIVRYWRFDARALALERRERPLDVRALIGGTDA